MKAELTNKYGLIESIEATTQQQIIDKFRACLSQSNSMYTVQIEVAKLIEKHGSFNFEDYTVTIY